jgi:hypothetical protein
LDLPARELAEIQVFFTEPSSGKSAVLQVQPLGTTPKANVVDRSC